MSGTGEPEGEWVHLPASDGEEWEAWWERGRGLRERVDQLLGDAEGSVDALTEAHSRVEALSPIY